MCHPHLIRLSVELPELDELIPEGQPVPEHDVYSPCFRCRASLAPRWRSVGNVPPLTSKLDAGILAAWEERLARLPGRRIGIVWSGNPTHENDHNRSMSLGTLAPLLNVPGASFVILQKEIRETDRHLVSQLALPHFGEEMRDFADTAAPVRLHGPGYHGGFRCGAPGGGPGQAGLGDAALECRLALAAGHCGKIHPGTPPPGCSASRKAGVIGTTSSSACGRSWPRGRPKAQVAAALPALAMAYRATCAAPR